MQILKMNLLNFQGMKDLEIDFNGENTNIFGDNATGKTTVYNAFTWLLYDKDSVGSKNFTPKTYDVDGEMHNLEHSVSVLLKLDSGRILGLKKVYKEVYKKTRGKAQKEFSTHTSDYFVDDVPVKQKDFNSEIENLIGDIDKVKILSDYLYFPEKMGWKERRKVLLEVCGDLSDFDIMDRNPEFKELKKILLMDGTEDQYHTADEYAAILKEKMSTVNKEIKSIPDRISELDSLKQDCIEKLISEEEINQLNSLKESLLTETQALIQEKELAKTESGQALNLKTKISESKSKLYDAEAAYKNWIAEDSKELNADILSVNKNINQFNNALVKIEGEIEILKIQINNKREQRDNLVSEVKEIKASKRDISSDVCPTCGRALEFEQIEEARRIFEENKLAKIAKLTAKGQAECSKDLIKALEDKLSELYVEQKASNEKLEEEKIKLLVLTENRKEYPEFKETEEGMNLYAEIADFQKQLESENFTNDTSEIDEKIEAIESEIESIRQKLADNTAMLQQIEHVEKKINELTRNERKLADSYEEYEGELALCHDFIRVKTSSITEGINKHFKSINFKLFENQINGGINEICTALVPSPTGAMVKFENANNASRINAGLEIIDVLGKAWGIELPVFVDNAESVTKLSEISNQVIRLVVSENDKKLRVERG